MTVTIVIESVPPKLMEYLNMSSKGLSLLLDKKIEETNDFEFDYETMPTLLRIDLLSTVMAIHSMKQIETKE